MNYCIASALHGDNQPGALLRCNRNIQLVCSVDFSVSDFSLDNTP